MEFRFDLSSIFTNPIIKINSNLLPANFRGDRRTALETTTKMAEIINTMGECSAKAQGLSKPVTTAQKLRQSDQNLYLLGDPNAGKNGAVLGLLKVGKKTLYVFDNNGDTQTVNAPCVLDFYVHESRQRSGLGKTLFEMMLKEENFLPKKLAIDRPSDKLLGFLKKHYGLHKSIPQMNNFVIYEGFFDDTNNITTNNNQEKTNNRVEITASPNTALFGTQFGSEEYKRNKQQCAAANIQTIQNTPVGRYAAPRPACSMAEIIHSTTASAKGELKSDEKENETKKSDIETTAEQHDDNLDINIIEDDGAKNSNNIEKYVVEEEEEHKKKLKTTNGLSNNEQHNIDIIDAASLSLNDDDDDNKQQQQQQNIEISSNNILNVNKPSLQQHSINKMHTGLKNISFNVGMAVSPTNKMEFERDSNKIGGGGSVSGGHSPIHDNTDAQSTVSSVGSGDGYTDQGYFDLKFYHNKLW